LLNEAIEGETGMVQCNFPDVDLDDLTIVKRIIWYQNGVKFVNDGGIYVNKNFIYFIAQFNYTKDNGLYECEVEFKNGQTFRSGSVIVRVKCEY
jgi:hypothetical protein